MSAALASRSSGARLWRSLKVQIRVVSALMIREVVSRYGHENLGFFWVIGEPLLLTAGVMGVWSLTNQTHGSEVGVIPFALTGYSFLTLWRHIVFKSMNVMQHNVALAYHGQVKFFDIYLARVLAEVVGIFAAFWVAYLPLWLLGLVPPLRDPLVLIAAWCLTAWFSFAVGLLLAAASELSETMHQFLGPVMYLTLPLTGAFFMVDWLPPRAQEIMLWSPLVHAIEMFRSGLFPEDFPTEWDAGYLALSAFILTAVGLPFFHYAQRHVQAP